MKGKLPNRVGVRAQACRRASPCHQCRCQLVAGGQLPDQFVSRIVLAGTVTFTFSKNAFEVMTVCRLHWRAQERGPRSRWCS